MIVAFSKALSNWNTANILVRYDTWCLLYLRKMYRNNHNICTKSYVTSVGCGKILIFGCDKISCWGWLGCDKILSWGWLGCEKISSWGWLDCDKISSWGWLGCDKILSWGCLGCDKILSWGWLACDKISSWCWFVCDKIWSWDWLDCDKTSSWGWLVGRLSFLIRSSSFFVKNWVRYKQLNKPRS